MLVVVVALGVWLAWPRTAAEGVAEVASPGRPAPRVTRLAPAVTPVPPRPVEPPPPRPRDGDPYAAVGEALGWRWIHCRVGELAPGFQAPGLHEPEVEDGVLTAFVRAREGGTTVAAPAVYPDCSVVAPGDQRRRCLRERYELAVRATQPDHTLVWWAAEPDVPGSCALQAPRRVRVVVTSDVEEGTVWSACTATNHPLVGGRAELEVWADTDCALNLWNGEGAAQATVRLTRDGGVEMPLVRSARPGTPTLDELASTLDERVQRADARATVASDLEAVLEWPDLDPAVREKVQVWRDREEEARHRAADAEAVQRDDTLELLERAEELLERARELTGRAREAR